MERRDSARRRQLIERVRGEFEEMPGLNLTLAQARLLFGVHEDICRRVLNDLVACGFLSRTSRGMYRRAEALT
ncbi:MAG: hypothetical protein ACE148_03260 [Vicinamibacterales bacterium]